MVLAPEGGAPQLEEGEEALECPRAGGAAQATKDIEQQRGEEAVAVAGDGSDGEREGERAKPAQEREGEMCATPAQARQLRFAEAALDGGEMGSALPAAANTGGAAQATEKIEQLMLLSLSPRSVRHRKRHTLQDDRDHHEWESADGESDAAAASKPGCEPEEIEAAGLVVGHVASRVSDLPSQPWSSAGSDPAEDYGETAENLKAEAKASNADAHATTSAAAHASVSSASIERGLWRAGRRAAMGPAPRDLRSAESMAYAVRMQGAILPAPAPRPKLRQADFNTTARGRARQMSLYDGEKLALRKAVEDLQQRAGLLDGQQEARGAYGPAPRVLSRDAYRCGDAPCAHRSCSHRCVAIM